VVSDVFVEWPVERPGDFWFRSLCLLVSPIFAGFLSALLSTLLLGLLSWFAALLKTAIAVIASHKFIKEAMFS
jgi:hypothetical protein